MCRYVELELSKVGSSTTRFGVMNALVVHNGTMTPTGLSKWMFRAKHTITSMLGVLERIGYVRRQANEHDRRSVNIVVTEKGWAATNRMTPLAETLSTRALSCFNEEELNTLMALLKTFRRHLLFQINSNTKHKD